MSTEHDVTKGLVTYIHSLGYDAHRAQFILLCLDVFDLSVIVRSVIFRGIYRYTDVWHTEDVIDSYDIDSIIGLDTYSEPDGKRYVLHTECREIIFTTPLSPEIVEHRPKKM